MTGAFTHTHTHSDGIVVSTAQSEHDPSVAMAPGPGQPELSLVPHPPHKVPQPGVLSDVIEAGGYWHQQHISCLSACARDERGVCVSVRCVCGEVCASV